jgi:hypothetical protein
MEKYLRVKSLTNAEAGGLILFAFFLGHMLKRPDPRELQKAYLAGCIAQMRDQQQGPQQGPQQGQQQGQAWSWPQGAQQPQPTTPMLSYDYSQDPQRQW